MGEKNKSFPSLPPAQGGELLFLLKSVKHALFHPRWRGPALDTTSGSENAYLKFRRFSKDPLVTGQFLSQLLQSREPTFVGTNQGEPPLLGNGFRAAIDTVRRCSDHGELG